MLYLFIPIVYQVKILMFFKVQTTNLTIIGQNMRYAIKKFNTMEFQIVSDTKFNT